MQKELESSELERKRTARDLLRAKDSIDQHKTEAERLTTSLAEFKAKHETDIAQMRKQAAGLQRDKSDLQSALEALKSDMAKKERSIKRFGSPLTPNGLSPYTPVPGGDGEEEEDVFGTTGGTSNRRKLDNSVILSGDTLASDFVDSSPDPSPSRPHLAPNHPNNEIEVLRQSLAHSQRQVNMLRGTVQREKELRMEYRRKLAEAEGRMVVEEVDINDDDDEENVDSKRPRPPRAIGRGRGRGVAYRTRGRRSLGQGPLSTPDIAEMNSDEDEPSVESLTSIPVSEPIPTGDDIQNFEDVNGVVYGHERHVSADGLDPAFANVLRPAPPSPTPAPISSPVREVVPRGGRRTRGGVPRNAEPRPPSLVEPAGALAAELGMSDEVINPELVLSPPVDTMEIGCQTDPEPAPEPVIITVAPPMVEKVETAVQARIIVETNEVSLQATPECADVGTAPVIPLVIEVEIQTISLEPTKVDIDVQTLPTPGPTTPPLANATVGVTRRGTIVGNSSLRTVETEDELGTDTGTETEGEYTDAPEYPVTSSLSDFYSTRTGPQSNIDTASMRPQESTTEFHFIPESDADDSDQESIKASTLSRPRTSSRITSGSIGHGYAAYDTRTPKASLPPPPPLRFFSEESIQVDVPVPEVKDTSMQTDDWVPPPPPPPPSPPPSSAMPPVSHTPSFTLLRVGPHTQQFQYIAPPSGQPSSSPTASLANTSKDSSSATIIVAPRRTSSLVSRENDRRPSIEAALASEEASRARTQSTQSLLPSLLPSPPLALLPPPDKTRPPTMTLPPPPKMPPPPEKKISTGSARDMLPPREFPPPRPTSPPPPELIQRATTPVFGNQGLLVPSRTVARQHGGSMPPLQSALGNRPSTNSFRSAANAASHANVSARPGASAIDSFSTNKQQSTTSLVSSRHSSLSRRSSMSSDKHEVHVPGIQGLPKPSNLPPPKRPSHQSHEGGSTDPAVIHAITQTMIGEFLYKYTRKVVGKGHGDRRHKRFFWVHPYTKTLYWSSADPGSSNVSESSAKSGDYIESSLTLSSLIVFVAYIDAVRSVLDPNPLPPGLYQYSVVVSTPQREMKITAPTKERHDIWFNVSSISSRSENMLFIIHRH